MSSLIEKIQRSTTRKNDNVGSVVLSGQENEASQLNTTGLGEKFKLIKSRNPQSEEALFETETPIWLEAKDSVSSEISVLLNTALKIIEETYSSNSSRPLEGKVIISSALERARRLHSEEFLFSRYDLALAEHELKLLLAGPGPLVDLFQDRSVTDIFVDSFQDISVRRKNKTIQTPISFRSPREYKLFLEFLERRASSKHSSFSACKQFVLRGEEVALS